MEGEKHHFEKREGDALVAELSKLLEEKLVANPVLNEERFDMVLDFMDTLKTEKGYTDEDMRACRLFHVLAGSTEPAPKEMEQKYSLRLSKVDLPGKEFETYIRSL